MSIENTVNSINLNDIQNEEIIEYTKSITAEIAFNLIKCDVPIISKCLLKDFDLTIEIIKILKSRLCEIHVRSLLFDNLDIVQVDQNIEIHFEGLFDNHPLYICYVQYGIEKFNILFDQYQTKYKKIFLHIPNSRGLCISELEAISIGRNQIKQYFEELNERLDEQFKNN